jgi:hypothetical protein
MASRGSLAVVLAIGATLAALATLAQGAAGILSVRDPQSAVNWRIAGGEAFSALAEQTLTNVNQPDRLPRASHFARAALIAAPLDPRAVRVLALAAEIGGDHAAPVRLMRVGDRLSRRDLLTQVWLFEHALQGRDWQDASLHADALMRGEMVGAPLSAAMIHAMAEPGALAPFVDRLAANPEWRRPFMSGLTWASDDRALPTRVLTMLSTTAAPPTLEETSRLVERYIYDKDYSGARRLWLGVLRGGAAAPAADVYNGGFVNLAAPPPFNWRLTESDAAEVGFGHADDGRPALHILSRQPSTAALAEEALVLPPGRYRLSVSAASEAGPAGDLFAWRLTCAQSEAETLGEVRLASGAAAWRKLTGDFVVPPAGCGAQWLRLYAVPREGFQPAEAWFSAMAITPAPGGG